MKRPLTRLFLAIGLSAVLSPLAVAATPAARQEFSFGIVAHPFRSDMGEDGLRNAIADAGEQNLAFLVVSGIKSSSEPCSDELYERRKSMLDNSKHGLVVSLSGSDWVNCRRANGRTAAMDRLNRLREMLFASEMSLGDSKIPLLRQSVTPKFRSYAENARWELGNVLFATINLPAENNHYVSDAGRNSEFEDRLIANRDWLQRLSSLAARRKMAGMVLFCDGNPFSSAARSGARRDGFAELRRGLAELAARFPGKVLVVYSDAAAGDGAEIRWKGNLGTLTVDSGWRKIVVRPAAANPFDIETESSTGSKR